MNKGKTVIVAMVTIASAMAIYAWWARYQASQRVLERFGADVAVAVRRGDKVELLRLSSIPPTNPSALETETFSSPNDAGATLYVTSADDITKAPGLIHARHHLLHDKGFRWNEPRKENCVPEWKVALRFTHPKSDATWLLDFPCERVFIVQRNEEVGIEPIVATALTEFFAAIEQE